MELGFGARVKGRVNQQGADVSVQNKSFSNVKVTVCRFLKQTNKYDKPSSLGW